MTQPTLPPAPQSPPPGSPAPVPPPGSPSPAPASSWQTPPELDGPAPGVRFAGPGARFVAYIVDGFVAGIIVTVVALLLSFVVAGLASAGADTAAGLSAIFLVVAVFAVMLLYFPYFWAKQNGQTPGMKLMRIRVVRDADGGPIGWGPALLRLVGYWISSAVFYLGYIWILVDKRRRGWHDLIAGTCVIEV
jgi:uncharacterized RDD family membrane protein YckC